MPRADCTGEIILEEISEINRNYEFIERKGAGHPDTLADELAEELSITYANYTLSNFGYVLHHNFDKVGLLGGSSFVKFGEGRLTKPIRVLLNGRASTKFGDKEIPLNKLLSEVVFTFLKRKFPMINPNQDVEIHYNLSNKSSPGKTDLLVPKEGTRKYWFEPRSSEDIKETKFLGSNDTSLGVGFYPMTVLANSVLNLSELLASPSFKENRPWLGSDIKIMASRIHKHVALTICVPQISLYVNSLEEYKRNLLDIKREITNYLAEHLLTYTINLSLNTRDDYDTGEIYLTAIGSSIESGDEGLVGRGNRINGLICTTSPYTMEGACGKNPVYHIGKVYNLAAQKLARKLYELLGNYVEVFLVSQSGRLLIDPWKTVIGISMKLDKQKQESIMSLVVNELNSIPEITRGILNKEFRLF